MILENENEKNEFYTRMFPKVRGLCYNFFRNDHDAEDAAQDSFIRFFNGLKQFDESRSKPETYLYRITSNCCKNILRERRTIKREAEFIPKDFDVSYKYINKLTTIPNQLKDLIDKETAETINQLIDKYSGKYSKQFKEISLSGASYKEILAKSNLKFNTLGTRLQRIRNKIRMNPRAKALIL